MPDRRDPDRIQHAMFEMVAARAMAIACGYKDAIDHDRLCHDPLMKIAVGRHPQTGTPVAPQSAISRSTQVGPVVSFERRCMIAVAGYAAEECWQGSNALELDLYDCAVMSETDWRMAGCQPVEPTPEVEDALIAVATLLERRRGSLWPALCMSARNLIVGVRPEALRQLGA